MVNNDRKDKFRMHNFSAAYLSLGSRINAVF